MRIPRIYTQQNLTPNTTVSLEPQASHHLSKVLRMQVDQQLLLFNGNGNEYPALIQSISKKSIGVSITSCVEQEKCAKESPLAIHLGISISKGDRMDWVIQKTTELGVTEITPLFAERSTVKLKAERLDKKTQHWQHIAISACEQCGRTRVPLINHAENISTWINAVEAEKKWVLHHRNNERLDPQQSLSSASLLIGPEGGLSDIEIKLAEENGFSSLSLGPRVLRTETAPLVALTLLQSIWGDI